MAITAALAQQPPPPISTLTHPTPDVIGAGVHRLSTLRQLDVSAVAAAAPAPAPAAPRRSAVPADQVADPPGGGTGFHKKGGAMVSGFAAGVVRARWSVRLLRV